MELTRHLLTNFYLNQGTKFFIYWKNNNNASHLIFDNTFISTDNKNWVLFFYETETGIEQLNENNILKVFGELGTHNAAILWADEFGTELFESSQKITLDKNIISGAWLSFKQNNLDRKHQFSLTGIDGSKIEINTNDDLFVTRNDGRTFQIKINESISNFENFAVGLLNETSCVKFTSAFDNINTSLNVSIPYVSKKTFDNGDPSEEAIITANIFDKKNLVGCHIQASYFPYNNSNNSRFKIIKNNSEKSIKTNFIDTKGNNLETIEIEHIELAFSKIVLDESLLNNRYILSPIAGKIKTNKTQVLVGYSGTESFITDGDDSKIYIEFKKGKNILVNEEAITIEDITTQSEAGYFVFLPEVNYNFDSEKSPLFRNNSNGEINYDPIPIARYTSQDAIPLMPTLSFIKNPELVGLERIFSKIRQRDLTKNNPAFEGSSFFSFKNYVTPQGFLRNGDTIDYINPKDTVKFEITNVTLNSDFNLSISKDDVFFVLTPAMLNNPSVAQGVNVFFNIGFGSSAFQVALNDFKSANNDTFIIFKFSRSSFKDLLEDETKWSNFGAFKPADYPALRDSIKQKSTFKDNENGDYKYFNELILTDPNWNGVVILNIPILEKGIPKIFDGLMASQSKDPNSLIDTSIEHPILDLQTTLKFQYVAFPVNRTKLKGETMQISNTSFYSVIDYDIIGKDTENERSIDYAAVCSHFTNVKDDLKHRFLLTKLLVRFENSTIKNFKSFAFWQIPDIFDNSVTFEIKDYPLSHATINPTGEKRINLIRLEGNYQKTNGGDEFNFMAQSELKINFEDDNVLKDITVSKIGFTCTGNEDEFRFDIDAKAQANSWSLSEFMSIENIDFQNVGFKFKINKSLPELNFDVSKLLVFPKINFDGNGFLSSFPIKFSYFQTFKLPKINIPGGFAFGDPDFDFFKLHYDPPKIGNIDLGVDFANLFSFVFDFDLGTLGNLGGLKALKGQLLVGWSFRGGFAMGFKLNGPSGDGLHLDLFGAVKLDVENLYYGKFKPKYSDKCSAYFLKLNDARLTIFGKPLPDLEHTFNGIIITDFSDPAKKISWLINYDNQETGDLILGLGQRMGPPLDDITSTVDAIENLKNRGIFKNPLKDIDGCNDIDFYNKLNFRPERNWLIASEAILPKDWPIELKFIFNDPDLYGMYLGFKGEILKGFKIDVLYKKLSENLGVYATEIQLPDEFRNQDLGGAFLKLPNIGIEIYTNGDWKVDIGFPFNSNDWSRSGFLQLRSAPPFVGFFGFYMMMSKVASLTLFKGIIDDTYSTSNLHIIQAGFALRVGIGFYYDKGILYLGASITVYGILEGAFAFEKQNGLAQLFPDHFAVLGRVGAIAELVGYVNFGIIKASVYLSLRAEFGMLLVYIGNDYTASANGGKLSKGIQPVIVYIEGEVVVRVIIKIGCVKIRLSFNKTLRFEYTIGGGGNSGNGFVGFEENLLYLTDTESLPIIPITIEGIKNIPMIYLPAFSKTNEDSDDSLKLMHTFMIPFFGKLKDGDKIKLSNQNILKDKIIRPFFKSLLEGLVTCQIIDAYKYETIRSILVNGYAWKEIDGIKTKVKIDLNLNGYVPTFISGINSTDKSEVDEILKTHFLFTDEELKGDEPDNSINRKYQAEHLAIPAPISKHIKIVDSKNTLVLEKEDGFKIKIEGLVDMFPTSGSEIKEILDYDEDNLKWIEHFYDDYKTQFLDRRENGIAGFAPEDAKDLRDKIIIPEFFKLIALLTLEALQSSKDRVKGEPEYNPTINVNNDGNFTIDGDLWETNNAIPEIIGQINYFYNSGLRLPYEYGNDTTKSIYKMLDQEEIVKPINLRNLSKIKVLIDNEEITKDLFENDTRKTQMLDFIDNFKSGNGFSFDKLREEFEINPIQFMRPFRLLPVKLAVQNGKLESKNEFRFFEIPGKLSKQTLSNAQYSFEVNYAEFKSDTILFSTNKPNIPKLTDLQKCLNIEVKVKMHSNRILEIVDVFSDNLNLMNALHNDALPITLSSIDFYFKPEPSPDQPQENISLTRLTTAYATILKTNLSPRTSPPIFKMDSVAGFAFDEKTEYWEDSNGDQSNFKRLIWEALTTNNGGYYLILDKEFETNLNGTIIISFASNELETKTPAYFNALKLNIENDVANTKIILENLKNNTHYLFIDSIKLSNDTITNKEVLEYHPAIPAHTVGFDVKRNTSGNTANYNNYLPMEFRLERASGKAILSEDKVLPIMPTNENGLTNETKLIYNHLTPLVLQSKNTDSDGNNDMIGRNTNRYTETGNTFKVGINLRDVFGNRTNQPNEYIAIAAYTHLYFDKIVPIESWPLMQFSYWFKEYDVDLQALKFDISLTCNILEILDMAAIEKMKNNVYKYKEGDSIEDADIEKLKGIVPGLLSNLYTILAQLTDIKTIAKINNIETPAEKEKWRIKVLDLISKLENLFIRDANKKYHMPSAVIATSNYSVVIQSDFKLKNELLIEISLNREDTNCLMHSALDSNFKNDKTKLSELVEPYIWDYDLTYKAIANVKALNMTVKTNSKLADLNAEIRNKTNDKFSLGISSEVKKQPDRKVKSTTEKVIYLINNENIKSIRADMPTQTFDQSCYFGIKPISKNLWSGNYIMTDGSSNSLFSNIDLDKSLRTVLEKIDQLLHARSLLGEIYSSDEAIKRKVKDLYNRLLQQKKEIVNNNLISQLDWVENQSAVNNDQKKEFRDLLLNKLNSFYSYEGMIRAKLKGGDVLKYTDQQTGEEKFHRLSVNLKSSTFNLVSSKIGDRNHADEWIILFDQTDELPEVSFDVTPEITHIEYDISDVPNSDEIQQSTWIQLLTPISINKYEVKNWRRILRDFPDKPIIIQHTADQLYSDNDIAIEKWDGGKSVGLWNYKLEIKDQYKTNDIIHIELVMENLVNTFADEKIDFKAFIAYWGTEFSKPKFDDSRFPSMIILLEKFVEDFERLSTATAIPFLSEEPFAFELYKTDSEWKIINTGTLKVEFPMESGIEIKSKPSVIVGPLNIFSDTNRVLSVLPKIKAIRNKLHKGKEIGNQEFVYETDTVQPENAATPHLQYHLPISLEKGVTMMSVFDQVAAANLPYKSTAKFLINTTDLITRNEMLPVIPIRQMEFLAGRKPKISIGGNTVSIDTFFDQYSNGYPSISLTIYNDLDENELPIFLADNIYKSKK